MRARCGGLLDEWITGLVNCSSGKRERGCALRGLQTAYCADTVVYDFSAAENVHLSDWEKLAALSGGVDGGRDVRRGPRQGGP
jgi:hypothetical protein